MSLAAPVSHQAQAVPSSAVVVGQVAGMDEASPPVEVDGAGVICGDFQGESVGAALAQIMQQAIQQLTADA